MKAILKNRRFTWRKGVYWISMTQKIHVNCDLRHFLISGKIVKKKKGNIKQFVKKPDFLQRLCRSSGFSAILRSPEAARGRSQERSWGRWRRLLFVSPADDLTIGVAAVDDAYDEHAGDCHIPNDFIYMDGNVNFIIVPHFYKPSLYIDTFSDTSILAEI